MSIDVLLLSPSGSWFAELSYCQPGAVTLVTVKVNVSTALLILDSVNEHKPLAFVVQFPTLPVLQEAETVAPSSTVWFSL